MPSLSFKEKDRGFVPAQVDIIYIPSHFLHDRVSVGSSRGFVTFFWINECVVEIVRACRASGDEGEMLPKPNTNTPFDLCGHASLTLILSDEISTFTDLPGGHGTQNGYYEDYRYDQHHSHNYLH